MRHVAKNFTKKGMMIFMLNQIFTRPSGEKINGENLIKIISNYILADTKATYEFTVGTDSQSYDKTKMVEVIAVHRVGKGGIFFYNVEYINRIQSLRQKITEETQRSLTIADGLLEALELNLIDHDVDIDDLDIKFQIHCDIGHEGKTKALIKEITNWVTSLGYDCLIKPDSYTASGIANKYSK